MTRQPKRVYNPTFEVELNKLQKIAISIIPVLVLVSLKYTRKYCVGSTVRDGQNDLDSNRIRHASFLCLHHVWYLHAILSPELWQVKLMAASTI